MFVLLIEDDAGLRELAQTVLEDADMLVVTASDGARALRLLERMKPDVIVTDMMMPVLDGFGFLADYRKLVGQTAPVIAVTAFEPYLARAEAAGAAAVLSKPYAPRALVELVRRVAQKTSATPLQAAGDEEASAPARTWSVTNGAGEAARLAEVLDLRLDEPAPERRLHDFVVEVAMHFDVPMALVSVVDADLQYWTAGCGFVPAEAGKAYAGPREHTFCSHAVAARAALVVQDSSRNPFFRDNPVLKEKGFRFYAGVPLITRRGHAVGTLCLLDKRPRRFTHFDLELLSLFANRVICALEWREKRATPDTPDAAFRHLQYYDDELGAFGTEAFIRLAVVEAARGAQERRRVVCVALDVPRGRLGAVAEALTRSRSRTLVGRLGEARLGWIVTGVSAGEARQLALDAAGAQAVAEAVQLDRYAGAIPAMLHELEGALGDAALA